MTLRTTGPLSVAGATAYIASTCFKTGPPGKVGVELELFVLDSADPTRAVEASRTYAALAGLSPLPGGGLLTTEPGGQLELSSQPAPSLAECVAVVREDLSRVRAAVSAAGLSLLGGGVDPYRGPRRVLDLPRYVAMETFFDRFGPEGRTMMCSTASVQVCLDAGWQSGACGYASRWHLLHALGPVLVAAFANSPLIAGVPTGWRSTRQAIWSRLDPSRTTMPAGSADGGDPREAWVRYVLQAQVLCVRDAASEGAADGRRDGLAGWIVPHRMSFEDWLRGAGPRQATLEDLDYHLTTLFPPVRPRGWLELRMIDAQPDEDWIVPTAVTVALLEDTAAATAAAAAVEPLRRSLRFTSARRRGAVPDDPWVRAARYGLSDPALRVAAEGCFAAVPGALARLNAPAELTAAVERFANRYVAQGRCPADDRLEEWRSGIERSVPADEEVAQC